MDLNNVALGEDPFVSLDPSKPSFVHPQQSYSTIFRQTPRLFHNGVTGETVGDKKMAPPVASAKKYEISIPGSESASGASSVDTSADERKNKRKKSTEVDESSKKSRKKGSDKKKDKKDKEKRVNTRDIAEMLKSQPARGKPDVQDDDEGEVEDDDGDDGGVDGGALDLGDPGRN